MYAEVGISTLLISIALWLSFTESTLATDVNFSIHRSNHENSIRMSKEDREITNTLKIHFTTCYKKSR